MSYFEGTNYQAKREDEGKPLFDKLSKEDIIKVAKTEIKSNHEYEKYCQFLEKRIADLERKKEYQPEDVNSFYCVKPSDTPCWKQCEGCKSVDGSGRMQVHPSPKEEQGDWIDRNKLIAALEAYVETMPINSDYLDAKAAGIYRAIKIIKKHKQ